MDYPTSGCSVEEERKCDKREIRLRYPRMEMSLILEPVLGAIFEKTRRTTKGRLPDACKSAAVSHARAITRIEKL
jgi:hypothetical protein